MVIKLPLYVTRFWANNDPEKTPRVGLKINSKGVLLDLTAREGIRSLSQLAGREEELRGRIATALQSPGQEPLYPAADYELLAPIRCGGDKGPGQGDDPVWAAGGTYRPDDNIPKEEKLPARAQLFYKAGPGDLSIDREPICIRGDSQWNVTEPELTMVLAQDGHKLVGVTLGHDMGSGEMIEENPYNLSSAKVYHRSAAVSPWVMMGVSENELKSKWSLSVEIERRGQGKIFNNSVPFSRFKWGFTELIGHLFKSRKFDDLVLFMTGTGIVNPKEVILKAGDVIRMKLRPTDTKINEGLSLTNTVKIV